MISRNTIVDEAMRWIRTPWIHQAELCGVGADCIGVLSGIARACGIKEAELWRNDPQFKGYSENPNVGKLKEACALYLDPVPIGLVRIADIFLFSYWGEPKHFGLICETHPRLMMIHAYRQAGEVVKNGVDLKWQRRIVAAFSFRGVA